MSEINVHEFNELIEENRNSTVGLAKIVAQAKGSLGKKAYSEFISESGLSKDQVSRLLKRSQLLSIGFGECEVGAYSDNMVLKLTNKQVEEVEELQIARKELAKGEIDFNDFKELFETYRIVKTENQKFSDKVDGVLKALDKFELNDECLTENANKLKTFVDEWGLEMAE